MSTSTAGAYCQFCGQYYNEDVGHICPGRVAFPVIQPQYQPIPQIEGGDNPRLDAAYWRARAEAAEARAERYERWLQRIDNWAKAYPLDVFPEPDFRQVYVVLKAAGISLDQVSASNMRHVIQGVEGMVEKALKGGEE